MDGLHQAVVILLAYQHGVVVPRRDDDPLAVLNPVDHFGEVVACLVDVYDCHAVSKVMRICVRCHIVDDVTCSTWLYEV